MLKGQIMISIMKRVATALATAMALTTMGLAFGGQAAWAQSATLKAVQDRGMLNCGSNGQLAGFGAPDPQGNWTGFDVDFCRAIAAAIFNDPTKVKFVPLIAANRFTALQSGEIDVLSRNTTWTMERDTTLGIDFAAVNFYDGQGFMVRKSLKVNSALELNDASVCVQQGTTTELNLADYFRQNHMALKSVTFATLDEAIKAYDTSRCDSFTTDFIGTIRLAADAYRPKCQYRVAGNHLQGAAQSGGSPGRRHLGRSRSLDAFCDGRCRGARRQPAQC